VPFCGPEKKIEYYTRKKNNLKLVYVLCENRSWLCQGELILDTLRLSEPLGGEIQIITNKMRTTTTKRNKRKIHVEAFSFTVALSIFLLYSKCLDVF
jgi:GTP-binding protein EngB required for normal cell division